MLERHTEKIIVGAAFAFAVSTLWPMVRNTLKPLVETRSGAGAGEEARAGAGAGTGAGGVVAGVTNKIQYALRVARDEIEDIVAEAQFERIGNGSTGRSPLGPICRKKGETRRMTHSPTIDDHLREALAHLEQAISQSIDAYRADHAASAELGSQVAAISGGVLTANVKERSVETRVNMLSWISLAKLR